MVVYSHFGGVPELTRAVIDHGFTALDTAFGEVAATEDPVADLATLALTCRRVARQSPHLYDLMFGLSTRATYRPLTPYGAAPRGTASAFRDAYARIFAACGRLVDSGRVADHEPDAVAAQMWSLVHGFIALELAGTLADTADPVRDVLMPLGVNLAVGLVDSRERAQQSHEAAASLHWVNDAAASAAGPSAASCRPLGGVGADGADQKVLPRVSTMSPARSGAANA